MNITDEATPPACSIFAPLVRSHRRIMLLVPTTPLQTPHPPLSPTHMPRFHEEKCAFFVVTPVELCLVFGIPGFQASWPSTGLLVQLNCLDFRKKKLENVNRAIFSEEVFAKA